MIGFSIVFFHTFCFIPAPFSSILFFPLHSTRCTLYTDITYKLYLGCTPDQMVGNTVRFEFPFHARPEMSTQLSHLFLLVF